MFHLTRTANSPDGTNPKLEYQSQIFNNKYLRGKLRGKGMSYTKDDLKKKLLEMYPEIEKFGLSLALEFDESKDAWVVSFQKGNEKRHAFLDKKDADACIDGNACIYLGVLIAQYIKDLEMAISG
jgi:hypothetical protein